MSLLGFQILFQAFGTVPKPGRPSNYYCFIFQADCCTQTDSPLINSCSLAEMTLLRWALCSRQSFSASSQVCLWVKYLQEGEWRHKSNAFFIYYASRRVWRVLSAAVSKSRITPGGKEVWRWWMKHLWPQRSPFSLTALPSVLPVAVSVELPPAVLAAFHICREGEREEWERLERPDRSAYINGIWVCLCGGMQWNEPEWKPCCLLLQPLISFCTRTQITEAKLCKV